MKKQIRIVKGGANKVAQAQPVQTEAQQMREVAGNVNAWVREARQAREAFNPKAAFAALFVS